MHAAAAQDLGKFGRISPNKGPASMASPVKSPQVASKAEEHHAAAGSEDEDEAGGSNPECSHAACSAKVTGNAAELTLVAQSASILPGSVCKVLRFRQYLQRQLPSMQSSFYKGTDCAVCH